MVSLSSCARGDKYINTLRPRQIRRHFADDIFQCIFLNENVWIPIKISMKSVPKGPVNNIPALVQIMAWRRPGDKPLSEPMTVSLTTHICVTRPQWVKQLQLQNKGLYQSSAITQREINRTKTFRKMRRKIYNLKLNVIMWWTQNVSSSRGTYIGQSSAHSTLNTSAIRWT